MEPFYLYDDCSTQEAKQEFFLDAKDLRRLPYESSGGGIGCGAPSKFYKRQDLHKAALAKHGREGFEKKRAARAKRLENKRKREQAAAAALRLQQNQSQNNNNNSQQQNPSNKRAKNSSTEKDEDKSVKQLRSSLLRLARKNLKFKVSGAPDNWKVEVPAISPGTFAALVGRPQDNRLNTFVKNGAYYSETVNATTIFNCQYSDLRRFFSREGVAIRICEDCVTVKFKSSTSDLTLSGYGEISE